MKRNENDAAALQAKVAAKQAAAASAPPASSTAPILPKKVKKADAGGLDDLLNAGLSGAAGKKKAVSAK